MSIILNEDFFEINNTLTTRQIRSRTIPITVVPSHNGKFEPKFLDQLFDLLYADKLEETKNELMKYFRKVKEVRGAWWEEVLEQHMPFTKRHQDKNEPGSDFLDLSEAKFASGARYVKSGNFQATIENTENKTGTLRVCLCVWGQHRHKVFFMLIPHKEYSTWGKRNAKITIQNFKPMGALWDKYRCSFQDVIRQGV